MGKGKTPVFEKEKINRLRFGIKLNSIFWPIDRPALNQILNKLNYKDIRVSAEGSLGASKHNMDFYSDYTKLIFGFYADTVNALIEGQKEFFSVIQREYKTNMAKFVQFYEIEFVSANITDENVFEIFSTFFDDSQLKQDFEKIIGEQLQIHKLEFSKKGAQIQDVNWYTIELSPRTESGGNAYFCRILRRDTNSQVVYQTLRKTSETFEKLISHIEK